jgi:phosphoglycolate phosphatase-like HAD superfamily hydrolase
VPDTLFRAYVFDFDGTLVQSSAAKRDAFFDIFDATHAPAIEAVLSADPDGSRHVVVPAMVQKIEALGLAPVEGSVADLVARYASVASTRVASAPEMPGATALLEALSRSAIVYVASTTPHEELRRQLTARGWMQFLADAYGHPHAKPAVVAGILAQHHLKPSQLLVVGDGVSDAEAAAANGCNFHRIVAPRDLAAVTASRNLADV